MKNRVMKYTFLLVLLLSLTTGILNVYAGDIVVGSSGEAGDVVIEGKPGKKCTTNCIYLADSKQYWKATGGGLRYTFVNKQGDVATQYGFTKSYNFKTQMKPNTFYNNYDGDSSKKAVLSGGGMSIEKGVASWPTHQNLIGAYNNAVSAHGAFINSLIGTPPQSFGGAQSQPDGWRGYGSYDFKFFQFFKENTNTKSFVANFLALIYAVKESYGESVSDELIKEIAGKACKEDIDLYVIIEPMMGFAIGSYTQDADATKKYCEQYKNVSYAYDDCLRKQAGKHGYKYTTNLRVVGTLADLGRMMFDELNNGILDGAIGEGVYKNNTPVYLGPGEGYSNKGQVAWIDGKDATIYNTRAIPWFGVTQKFDRVLTPGFYYQPDYATHGYMSYGDFTSTIATGQGMWGLSIAVGSDSCEPLECDYVDGTLTSNNPEGSWKELPGGTSFKNLAEFAFAPKDQGGLDCCESLQPVITTGELKDNAEWKQAYSKYCASGSVCKIIDSKTIMGPGNKTYNPDDYPTSGFKDFGDFITDKDDRGGLNCCDDLKGKGGIWDEAYNKYCEENCCKENPIPKADKYDGELNNCCLDSDTSVIQQTNVTELFCYDNGVLVDKHYPKCNADTYVEKNINEYCDLYCSERLVIQQPRPITAITGRYFSFPKIVTETGKDTTAPYLRAYKRCSVRTEWDKWYDAYKAQVDKAIEAYNRFQEKQSFLDLYKAAKDHVQEITIKGTQTCECNTPSDNTKTATYKIYTFPTVKKQYFKLKLDEGKEKSFEALKLINDGNTYFAEHTQYSNDDFDQAKSDATPSISCGGTCTGANNTITNNHSNGTSYTYNGNSAEPAGSSGTNTTKENIDTVINAYTQAVNAAKSDFSNARGEMKRLEELLVQCEAYFSGKPNGVDVPESLEFGDDITPEDQKIYQLDPKLDFSYTQVVLNDKGQKVSDKVKIEFVPLDEAKNKACEFDGPVIVSDNASVLQAAGYITHGKGLYASSDEELLPAEYSSKYSTGGNARYYELMQLFKIMSLTDKTATTFDQDIIKTEAEAYKAQKKFTEFAKYKAECVWIDKGTSTTLYPSGLVENPLSPSGLDKEITVKNKTRHDREYEITSTTLTGSYQTNWNMTGLGEKGKFDKYIQEKGTACSMTDKSSFNPAEKEDDWRFTCKIKIESMTINTGYCEPSAIVAPVGDKNMEPCDPADYVMPTLTFKIVDSSDLFPNTTKVENGFMDSKNNIYGYNWVTPEGQEVYNKIVEDSNNGTLFAPDHLSETIRLSSNSITLIKQYNAKAEGGYSDFNLICECPDTVESTLPDNQLPDTPPAGCEKCKSVFLENLQNNVIKIDGSEQTIKVWANSPEWTLEKIREERLGW